MSQRLLFRVLLVILSLLSFNVAWANKEEERGGADENRPGGSRLKSIFEAQIVRVADLGAGQPGPSFSPNGSDLLTRGEVEVKADRLVEIELVGAAQTATYNAFFCRFGFPPPCLSLTPATRLQHVGKFSDLAVGQRVEVKGFAMDKTILATRVEVREEDD